MYSVHVAHRWLQIVGGGMAALAITWLIAQAVLHLRLLNVQTGSMQPTFRPGDALVMRETNRDLPVVGSIVSYHSTRNPNELVTHRVVRVDAVTDSFQTKGDALTVADPPVRRTLLAGKAIAIIPGIGKVLGWLQSWPGLIACVYVPAAAIVVSELLQLNRRSGRKYRLNINTSGMIMR